ncbi:MgtC/SapB family protein [Soonwooa sp.]|uniref:MgtC/SapB family protein n=1 Tax=Soonwooa sp. TaxID=1938592 RepID=UPI00289822DC|nr:MgtC/SapB family protein [Soonwooa sp.]
MEEFINLKTENEIILISISLIVGMIIGAEREYYNKSAGLRTFVLVSFGSCIFTILSAKMGMNSDDRIAANIITGIGFIGGGVIFKDENRISGITTATTIWATASLGMAVGTGYIYLGLFGMVLVILILNSLTYIQSLIDMHHKIRNYHIITSSYSELNYCKELFGKYNLKYEIIGENHRENNIDIEWRIVGKNENHKKLVQEIRENSRIIEFEY